MRYLRLGYIFPGVIFLYGLVGMIRQKIRIGDPGGSHFTDTGMAAVLDGLCFMLLAVLIFNIVRSYERHVASGGMVEFEPATRTNKVLFIIWILVSLAGNFF